MSILVSIKVGKYYRTTIPREIRRIIGMGSGDYIDWIFLNSKIIVGRGVGVG